ncbi:MAG: hypothetical protein KAI69_04530 [Deltaproteobacteria bacterium]|nr:hypothetical protein [Deltaproteobacteria bacterium]
MQNKELKIDIDLDDNWNGVITIECPDCSNSITKPFSDIHPKSEIPCPCGFIMSFEGGDLSDIQRGLDDLKRTLENLGQ